LNPKDSGAEKRWVGGGRASQWENSAGNRGNTEEKGQGVTESRGPLKGGAKPISDEQAEARRAGQGERVVIGMGIP